MTAVFLLFAAALTLGLALDATRAEASLPRSADAVALNAASLEPEASTAIRLGDADVSARGVVAPDDALRLGFAEELCLLEPDHARAGFVLFERKTCRCERTYARNNPLKYVDPDGRAIKSALWQPWLAAAGRVRDEIRAGIRATPILDADGSELVAVGVDLLVSSLLPRDNQELIDGSVGFGIPMETPGIRLLSTTSRNFRPNLMRLLGKTAQEVAGEDAHHMLPQVERLAKQFRAAGLNVHDPKWGAFLEHGEHLSRAAEFNADWTSFMSRERTAEEIEKHARVLAEKYNISW